MRPSTNRLGRNCWQQRITTFRERLTTEDYDGTSEYACACGVRIGSWTGNRLADGELEPRYGHTKRKEK